jgi:hypothetical protein
MPAARRPQSPAVGQVIRYAYLWKSEADAGQEEGLKARPSVVVIILRTQGRDARVLVAPITHAEPVDPDSAVEVPPKTRRRIGLDDARQWIVLSELNDFLWPGPDLRPAPATGTVIGELPARLTEIVLAKLETRIRARKVAVVTRTDPD